MIHSARFPWGDSVCTLVFCTESGVHHSLLRRDLEILGRNVPPCCCLRLLGGQFSRSRCLGVLSSLGPFVTLPAAFCECLSFFWGWSRAAGSRAKEEHERAAPSLGRSPPAVVPKQRVTSHRHGRGPAGGEPERVRSAAAAAAHTARPNRLGHARNRPSPLKGKSGLTPNRRGKEKLGVRRGRTRRPDASGSRLPLPERGEVLQARRSPWTHLKAGEAANRQTAPGYCFLFLCSPACSRGPSKTIA
ncbi:hypothetical protein NDU88_002293 [Pleurodeles waltl]|uniref:Uncharacterized protein n=1 Tax=Pleurodeles waltl TaxID=8319 RepID=A0AAV7TKB4_PLEWA|nr:hypothetical protein NDU88_002293 [Pleurodeles waltl]